MAVWPDKTHDFSVLTWSGPAHTSTHSTRCRRPSWPGKLSPPPPGPTNRATPHGSPGQACFQTLLYITPKSTNIWLSPFSPLNVTFYKKVLLSQHSNPNITWDVVCLCSVHHGRNFLLHLTVSSSHTLSSFDNSEPHLSQHICGFSILFPKMPSIPASYHLPESQLKQTLLVGAGRGDSRCGVRDSRLSVPPTSPPGPASVQSSAFHDAPASRVSCKLTNLPGNRLQAWRAACPGKSNLHFFQCKVVAAWPLITYSC